MCPRGGGYKLLKSEGGSELALPFLFISFGNHSLQDLLVTKDLVEALIFVRRANYFEENESF